MSLEPPKNFEAPMKYRLRKIFIRGALGLALLKGKIYNNEVEPVIIRNVVKNFIDDSIRKMPLTPCVQVENKEINGVKVRIYKPSSLNDTNDNPIIIYYHGGAYFLGSPEFFEAYSINLSNKLNAVVVSVDYRMAPEHPFPTPTDDCYNVTKYILESSNEFGDTNKVILAGDSAGGNAVAVMTQRLKAENMKMPLLQVLIYPWTQMFNNRLPSHLRYEKAVFVVGDAVSWYLGITNKNAGSVKIGPCITYNHHINLITDQELKKRLISYTDPSLIPDEYKQGRDYYQNYNLNDEKVFPKQSDKSLALQNDPELSKLIQKVFTPEFSPGLADPENLIGLPDAYFIMSEMDPLKDEGLVYSQRLKNAGVKVDVKFYESTYHGISGLVSENDGYQIARDMQNDLIAHIKSIL